MSLIHLVQKYCFTLSTIFVIFLIFLDIQDKQKLLQQLTKLR